MAIELSISGIMGFLEKNDALLKDLRAAGAAGKETLKGLFARLEANRTETENLVARLGTTSFAVGKDANTRQRQSQLLAEIEENGKKIETFKDDPLIFADLSNERAALYVALASTYNDAAALIVTFTAADVDELKGLLRQATLDAQARERAAALLDAGIQLAKIVLKIAAKVVAA